MTNHTHKKLVLLKCFDAFGEKGPRVRYHGVKQVLFPFCAWAGVLKVVCVYVSVCFVYVGGGIEIWFAYVLALGFLLIRPQGLFGEKIIDRV